MNLVLDASVIVKPYLDQEQIGEKIVDIFFNPNFKIIEPEFWKVEVANAIRFILSEKLALQVMDHILELPFIRRNVKDWSKVMKLSYQNEVTIYDTIYHVVAIQENAILLTADQKYFNKIKNKDNIMLVSTFIDEFYS